MDKEIKDELFDKARKCDKERIKQYIEMVEKQEVETGKDVTEFTETDIIKLFTSEEIPYMIFLRVFKFFKDYCKEIIPQAEILENVWNKPETLSSVASHLKKREYIKRETLLKWCNLLSNPKDRVILMAPPTL